MRIWSLHPKYLDAKGLVALWRETLLAQKVLEGKTRGYTNHPQLSRFRNTDDPLQSISNYLHPLQQEAASRDYSFDASRISLSPTKQTMTITQGQLAYEFIHLMRKLEVRDPGRYEDLKELKHPDPHPLFEAIPGGIEDWEIIST